MAAEKRKRSKKLLNIVGPQIRQRRYRLGMTQEEFAADCQLHGLDISRGTLSQIEAQVRRVTDSELLFFSKRLSVTTDALFPADARRRSGKQEGH